MEIKTDFFAYMRIVMYTQKTGSDLQLIANLIRFFKASFSDYFSMIASVAVKFSSEPDFV